MDFNISLARTCLYYDTCSFFLCSLSPFPIFEPLTLKLQIPWRHCRKPTVLFLLPHLAPGGGCVAQQGSGKAVVCPWRHCWQDCPTWFSCWFSVHVLTVPGSSESILWTKLCALTVGPDLQAKEPTINNWTPVSVKVKLDSVTTVGV